MYPSHDGCFNNDGAGLLGNLQDQMIPFTDFERNIAVEPASSEGEFDECPFALCVFFGFGRIDEAAEGKQRP